MKESQRDLSWDFVKFVLMFLIVFGHFCPAGKEWTPVTRIVGLCAIPGFFFISGYFQSKITSVTDYVDKLRKTLLRIIVPMAAWGVFYVLANVVQMYFNGDIADVRGAMQFLKYSPFYIAGIFWFLTALLMCIVIGSLLSWSLSWYKLTSIVLIVLSPMFLCVVSPPFMEKYHFSFIWLFYAMGMLFRHVRHSESHVWSVLALVAFVVIAVIGVGYVPRYTFYYKSNVVGESSVGFILGRYALYIAATLSVIYGLKKIYARYKECYVIKQLALAGVDTLFIYCSHMMLLVFVYRLFLQPCLYHEHGNWSVRLMEFVVGFIMSLLVYLVLQTLCSYCKRFRMLRLMLMGISCQR